MWSHILSKDYKDPHSSNQQDEEHQWSNNSYDV